MNRQIKLPDFTFEKEIFNKGINFIGGVDEVGRGCFAGPVVAACVIFNSDYFHNVKAIEVLIKDSKKMSTIQKEKADKWIKDNCLSFGIGEVSVDQINKFGIKTATDIAFRKAVKNAGKNCVIDHLLVDAFYIPGIKSLPMKCQSPIIKGDNKSISIAAASIIAKVYRDELMSKISRNEKYKHYSWDRNKGYGTKEHRDAIIAHGSTDFHRNLFLRKLMES